MAEVYKEDVLHKYDIASTHSSSERETHHTMSKSQVFIVLGALFIYVAAVEEPVAILSEQKVQNDDGSYHFEFESANGIKVSEDGVVRSPAEKSGEPVVVHSGSVSYVGDDKQPVSLTYTADENGYRPEGAHLPVPPPVPEPIARAVQFILDHPELVKKNTADAS